jgi:gas vesicle protein GvpA/GvpJ/GvpM family
MPEHLEMGLHRGQGLVDVLDRILDKGLVIAGDIKINLANVELLTIQVRLLVCSIDKAEQIGMNWWRTDRNFSRGVADAPQLQVVNDKLDQLAARLDAMERKRTKLKSESTDSRSKSHGG